MNEPVIVVNILKKIVASMRFSSSINFIPGRTIQIVEGLLKIDNSITNKDQKYPLIAALLPIDEVRTQQGYYADVKIPRIVIAVKAKNHLESVLKRYETGATYQEKLYPLYYEFMKQLAYSKYTVQSDPDMFIHRKRDNPGIQPASESYNDYVDCIEILDLELKLNQIKTC